MIKTGDAVREMVGKIPNPDFQDENGWPGYTGTILNILLSSWPS
jgi:hypothetical protein